MTRDEQIAEAASLRGEVTVPQPSWLRLLIAVLTGGLAAWSVSVLGFLGIALFEGSQPATSLREAGAAVALFAVFGLPVVLVISIVVAWPLASLLITRGRVSLPWAILPGALVPVGVGTTFLAYRLIDGLQDRASGNSFSYGGAGGMLWEDSWPTALGWWNELETLLIYGVLGAIAGVVTRRVALGRWT